MSWCWVMLELWSIQSGIALVSTVDFQLRSQKKTHFESKDLQDHPLLILHFALLWCPAVQVPVSSDSCSFTHKAPLSLLGSVLETTPRPKAGTNRRYFICAFPLRNQDLHNLLVKVWKQLPYICVLCYSCLCHKFPSFTNYFFMTASRIPTKYTW